MVDKIPIGGAFINSLIVASSITIGVLVFGSMIGYALSKLDFQRKKFNFLYNHFYNDTAIPNYTYTTIYNYGKVWLD